MARDGSDHPDKPVVVLFRHDLRLRDNRALAAAAAGGKPVVPVFVLDEESPGIRPMGGARRWWLHHSLEALGRDVKALGGRLVLRRGPMAKVAAALCRETGADTVFWNRRYEAPAVEADKAMKSARADGGVAAESFEGQLLHEPWQISTGAGRPYRVFTPFWRALKGAGEPRDPVDAPTRLRPWHQGVASDALADWELLPREPNWAGGLAEEWTPGEEGAQRRLDAFIEDAVVDYDDGRDRPAQEGTSRLSPHLAHGEITPFQVWQAVREKAGRKKGAQTFLKEIGWREFCWHLLFHNPDLARSNFDKRFDNFAWSASRRTPRLWQQGMTGYPIVDAGMRQLWRTGWMHNRVRMITASFLIKDLAIDWRQGEQWFWDTLVDADPANNAANWQWVAGSGADAAPFFRIFNPVLQGRKFDPDGDYVRRYVPELAGLPDRTIHEPWKTGEAALEKARVKLGETYPVAAVDHGEARERALAEFQAMKGT